MQLDTAYRRRKRRHDGPSSLLAPSTGCPIERPRRLRRLLPKRLADAEALTPWHEIGCDVKYMIAVGYHLILLGSFNSFGKHFEWLFWMNNDLLSIN
jgi:hypothetical protein